MAKNQAAPNLESAAINISQIRERARRDLCDALDSRRGKKALVLDPKLSGPLSLIAQTSLLKEHGVENLYYLEKEPVVTECRALIYLVRPRVELMPLIAANVRAHSNGSQQGKKDHSVFFVPRRTIICEKVLEEEGVYGDLALGEYSLDLIPFEEDVLSLELDHGLRELHVEGDPSVLYYTARTLHQFQATFGTIPAIKAKGKHAQTVVNMMQRMRLEDAHSRPSGDNQKEEEGVSAEKEGEVAMLILIDRAVDLLTPMCTQLTYEGLADEILRVNNGTIELHQEGTGTDTSGQPGPSSGASQEASAGRPHVTKTRLNSSDPIFRELRDLNFGRACDKLREKSIAIQQDYKSIKGGRVEDQKVSDIKGFVKTVKDNMSGAGVDLHATIAKQLMDRTMKDYAFMKRLEMERCCVEGYGLDAVYDYVEGLMMKRAPITMTLRLLAVISLCNQGIPRKTFDTLRKEFLHAYGHEQLISLQQVESVGFISRREGRPEGQENQQINFPQLRRVLNLVVDNLDDNNPNDIAYAYSHSGYAPLSVRLVQQALKGKWSQSEEISKALPGPLVDITQTVDWQGMPTQGPPQSGAPVDGTRLRQKPVLVFFIGGVTFAEISALRFVSSQDSVNRDIIIASTKLVSGSTILEPLLVDPVRPVLADLFADS